MRVGVEKLKTTGEVVNTFRVYKEGGRWVNVQVQPDPGKPYKHPGLLDSKEVVKELQKTEELVPLVGAKVTVHEQYSGFKVGNFPTDETGIVKIPNYRFCHLYQFKVRGDGLTKAINDVSATAFSNTTREYFPCNAIGDDATPSVLSERDLSLTNVGKSSSSIVWRPTLKFDQANGEASCATPYYPCSTQFLWKPGDDLPARDGDYRELVRISTKLLYFQYNDTCDWQDPTADNCSMMYETDQNFSLYLLNDGGTLYLSHETSTPHTYGIQVRSLTDWQVVSLGVGSSTEDDTPAGSFAIQYGIDDQFEDRVLSNPANAVYVGINPYMVTFYGDETNDELDEIFMMNDQTRSEVLEGYYNFFDKGQTDYGGAPSGAPSEE